MILKSLKSNNAINLFLMPVAVIAFWLRSLWHPFAYSFYPEETGNVLFAPVYNWVHANFIVQVIISIVLAIALSFIIQLINDSYLFIRIKSKLPSLLFVMLIGGFTSIHTLHPVYFGALFILLAVYRLFAIFEQKKAYAAIFDVGFLWGIGALFYFNMVFIFPALLLSIILLGRETRWREFIILLLGLVLPFIFALSYGVITDKSTEILNVFYKNIVTPVNCLYSNTSLLIYLAALLFFIVAGTISLIKQFDTKKISSRKYFSVLLGIFILSIATFIFIPATSHEMFVILAIPTTYLLSNMFVFMKSKFWSECLFFLLLIVIIIMQFPQLFHV